jgi:hypothetical protein
MSTNYETPYLASLSTLGISILPILLSKTDVLALNWEVMFHTQARQEVDTWWYILIFTVMLT